MVQWMRAIGVVTTLVSAVTVHAAVTADEAKQLGGAALTVFGAEKTGNKDGTIPAYTGETIKVPASYDPKRPGLHPDPFNEKPLFSITAQNMAQYADKLTEGQKALFKTYSTYRMDVYPTHRTATYPKYVLDNTLKNATSCKGLDNELRLEGCYGGFPFPIPKTGTQAMWNHLMAPASFSTYGVTGSIMVPPNGSPVIQNISQVTQEYPMYDPAKTGVNDAKELFWKVRVDDLAPARRVGQKLVLIDALDQINVGRRAWQYIPGQRRVKLAPDLAYDTPSPFSGGASTMDDQKVFLGALDRFEWKLVGKQEKYIVHNSYAQADPKVCSDEKLGSTKYFPTPDCVRWELHRVWVVTGTLKPGFRHIYAKRTFYWDEDSYLAGIAESYDAAGKLYRVNTSVHFTMYEQAGAVAADTTYNMDLNTGIYYAITNAYPDGGGWSVSKVKQPPSFFSPEALAGEGIR